MNSSAQTVAAYLRALPKERRDTLSQVRQVMLDNIDPKFVELIQYGMIGYAVPHKLFADGYHCDPRQPVPFAGLASQKNHLSLYLVGVYFEGARQLRAEFINDWKASGKKLDMGKSCIRFKRVEDLDLTAIANLLQKLPLSDFLALYKKSIPASKKKPVSGAKSRK